MKFSRNKIPREIKPLDDTEEKSTLYAHQKRGHATLGSYVALVRKMHGEENAVSQQCMLWLVSRKISETSA